MKKNNNKGFSLVELIVVIAIMAVLVGVLAPSLLRYVEKTRVQKDASAISEVAEAIVIAAADETVYKEIATGSTTKVTVASGSAITVSDGVSGAEAKLASELANTIGSTGVTFSSASATTVIITITKDATTGTVTTAVTTPATAAAGASTPNTDWEKAIINAGKH